MDTHPVSPESGLAPAAAHPIRLVVADDLRRSRLTVFFRLILFIPLAIWASLWGIVVTFAVIANWAATLVSGTSPQGLHSFIALYLRFYVQVTAYISLLSNPYPPFVPSAERHPVDAEIDPPAPQSRWITGFRIVMIIPALILSYVLGYLRQILAFVAWFVCIVTGRMPQGIEDLGCYCLRYEEQTWAYAMILTDRYPSLASP